MQSWQRYLELEKTKLGINNRESFKNILRSWCVFELVRILEGNEFAALRINLVLRWEY